MPFVIVVVMTKYKEAAAFNRIYTEIGLDAETLMEKFVDTLLSLSREVHAFMMRNTPMKPLTDEQNKEHEKADVCYICHEPFHGKVKRKVRETMTTQQVSTLELPAMCATSRDKAGGSSSLSSSTTMPRAMTCTLSSKK